MLHDVRQDGDLGHAAEGHATHLLVRVGLGHLAQHTLVAQHLDRRATDAGVGVSLGDSPQDCWVRQGLHRRGANRRVRVPPFRTEPIGKCHVMPPWESYPPVPGPAGSRWWAAGTSPAFCGQFLRAATSVPSSLLDLAAKTATTVWSYQADPGLSTITPTRDAGYAPARNVSGNCTATISAFTVATPRAKRVASTTTLRPFTSLARPRISSVTPMGVGFR